MLSVAGQALRYGWRHMRRSDLRLEARAASGPAALHGRRRSSADLKHDHRKPIVTAYMMRTSDCI